MEIFHTDNETSSITSTEIIAALFFEGKLNDADPSFAIRWHISTARKQKNIFARKFLAFAACVAYETTKRTTFESADGIA